MSALKVMRMVGSPTRGNPRYEWVGRTVTLTEIKKIILVNMKTRLKVLLSTKAIV